MVIKSIILSYSIMYFQIKKELINIDNQLNVIDKTITLKLL